ncbi:Transcriptional regulatory protein YpdB [Xylophilus ampelinus]|nr:Transcriptional regulatory protein YpdB [Xylophilus ampelinus]
MLRGGLVSGASAGRMGPPVGRAVARRDEIRPRRRADRGGGPRIGRMGATTGQRNFYERYAPVRRPVEIGFWVVLMGLQAAFNTAVALVDARAAAHPPATWQVVSWELSSHVVLLALVPVLAAFERRFPLYRPVGWWRTAGAHVAGSLGFCALHVGGMVLLRKAVAWAAGGAYDFGGGASWLYEYLKDVRSYVSIVAGIAIYRLWLLRLQGEARVLDAPEPAGEAAPAPSPQAPPESGPPEGSAPPARPERFLVRKLRREFLIAAADIDWLQAQGNYVGLRVNGHDYLLRATLTDFLAQLDPARFVRVHRSHAVNLDRIREIEPTDGGDARLHLHDGSVVPCSRRYREALTGAAA